MYLALGGGPPGFAQGCSCPALLGVTIQPPPRRVNYGPLTRYGTAFQPISSTPCASPWASHCPPIVPHNPRPTTGGPLTWTGFRLNPVRSPLLGVSRLLSSRPGTEMFQFPGCPPAPYEFGCRCPAMKRDGLPHSEITGSWPACSSPVRFVARHVLPRHWFPEHPPYALSSLTTPSSAHRRPKGGSIAIAVHQADGIVSRETVLSCF